MRTMYDSVTPENIPRDAQMVAGYVDPDGMFTWTDAEWAMFPNSVKVRIAGHASTNDGHVLDVEDGDATPAQAPGWATMRRNAGMSQVTVYCSEAIIGQVQRAFTVANVAQPLIWRAAYPGGGAVLYPGEIAHQWIDDGPYDRSVVADYWPGVDASPVPPQPDEPTEEDGMEIFTQDGTTYHLWVNADGHARYRSYKAGAPQTIIDMSQHFNVVLDPAVKLARVSSFAVVFYGATMQGQEVCISPGPFGYFPKVQ